MRGRRHNSSESNTGRQHRQSAGGNGRAAPGVAGATQPSIFAARASLAATLVGMDAAYSAKRRRFEEMAEELVSRRIVTPGRVIMYYSQKLGIDNGLGMLGKRHRQRLANYAAAELGIADHEFWKMDVEQFGELLRAKYEHQYRRPMALHEVRENPIGLHLDKGTCQVFWEGKPISINPKTDFDLLARLFDSFGEIVEHAELSRAVRPAAYHSSNETNASPEVMEAVKHIRRAFREVGCTLDVMNVRGRGYMLIKKEPE